MNADIVQDETAAEEHDEGHPFYPHHIIDEMMIVAVVAGVILTLAILLPFHLHAKADPMFTPPGIKPEWYFLPMYQAIKYVPRTLGVMATGLVFALIIVWPFIDILLDRFSPRRPLYRPIAVAGILVALVFGGLGYICERDVTFLGREYHMDAKGVPHRVTGGEAELHAPTPKS